MALIGDDIDHARRVLNDGGLVGIPTETVYGLAANAFNSAAIGKIFAVKNRPAFDPLITHVGSLEDLKPLVTEIPSSAKNLIESFWPGPLTVVLPKSNQIIDLITSGLPTAAFRLPRHKLLQELLSGLDFPIVAPSANPFGYVSPTSAEHVNQQLGDKIDYILDGGNCNIGIESTIIGFIDDQPIVLRLGGLPIEDIEKVVGKVKISTKISSNPAVPGMQESHYSPSKKVVLGNIENLIDLYGTEKIGILSFTKKYAAYPNFVLSKEASLTEAAVNLFSGLRWFETQDIDIIITEKVSNKGLGKAINDRLTRASTK